MVKTTLVAQDITEGRRFLEALREPTEFTIGKRRSSVIGASHFRVQAAFWWYQPESLEWRLVIATPLVDEEGPLATYGDIQKLLIWHPHLNISLQDISVLSPKDERVKAFKKAMRIASDSDGVRLTHSALNGTFIEDAYVYRLP